MHQPEPASVPAMNCLAAGGEAGNLMRSIDWSRTSIGVVERWPAALRAMAGFLLANPFPMLLWWGAGFCQLYNDAGRPLPETKHPNSMGWPASECWAELWPIIGPLIESTFHGGAARMEDLFLEIQRDSVTEETHWSIVFSPVADETAPNGIGGVAAMVHEITEEVIGERRILLLRELGARPAEARTTDESCAMAARTFSRNSKDVPFALLYLISNDRKSARLRGAAGVEPGELGSPTEVELNGTGRNARVWPFLEVLASETMQRVEDLGNSCVKVPPGPWSDPPRAALVFPLFSSEAHRLAGFLVLGISSRLRFDNTYRAFSELVASQVSTVVANGRAQDLRESERRFHVLLESIPHQVWNFRPDGALGYWNHRLEDYTGLTEEQLGHGTWEALHPDDREGARRAWRKASSDGSPYELEQRIRGRDGPYRRFVFRATPVADESGRLLEWIATATDVEERRQAQEDLRQAQAELAHVARVAMLGELSASIAHELNQPLTAVVLEGNACLGWLRTAKPNLYEARAAANRMVKEGTRASHVVQRMRALMKNGPLQMSVLDMNVLIRDVLAITRYQLLKHHILLRTDLSPDLRSPYGDAVQLQQVVVNLIMNAIEATSAVSKAPREVVVASRNHGGDEILVSVRDSGVGLDPGSAGEIFKPFVTTKPGGMGLGLSISSSILKAHGGCLWAVPNEGQGATFQFSLPVRGAAEQRRATPGPA
jgi:PAS domain S-box-containing protein